MLGGSSLLSLITLILPLEKKETDNIAYKIMTWSYCCFKKQQQKTQPKTKKQMIFKIISGSVELNCTSMSFMAIYR